MVGANAQLVTGDNVVKVRVTKPRVFQAEDLATRGASGGFKVKGCVIRGGAARGGEGGVRESKAPGRVNEHPI
jgi:hypothetical protein